MSPTPNATLHPFLSAEQIRERVSALGAELSRDYNTASEVRLIGVLKGAWMFLADLMRELQLHVTCDFLGLSSYGAGATSSGVVRLTSDLAEPIEDLDVLLVEDIIDTGLTMRFLIDTLTPRRPRRIRTCVLLDKPSRRLTPITPDYVGFTIPDHFVVGYGLDWAGAYRQLPYIAICQPRA